MPDLSDSLALNLARKPMTATIIDRAIAWTDGNGGIVTVKLIRTGDFVMVECVPAQGRILTSQNMKLHALFPVEYRPVVDFPLQLLYA